MKLPVLVGQFPISYSIQENLDHILKILEKSQPGDLVVLPEGAVSGYSTDLSFLKDINLETLQKGLDLIRRQAEARKIHLWIGSLLKKDGDWVNLGFGFSPQREENFYLKINLANHERGVLIQGDNLPVFQLETVIGPIRVGVQICREIRYPEQWGWLARCGAQIIIHLNNAVGDDQYQAVWRSHLVSRAAETQRFVISANNAARYQVCPTMVIAPDGQVIGEVISDQAESIRAELDLTLISNWYLSQCREDVVAIKPADREADFPPSSIVS
jgi:predicted amidohydrolase